MIEYLLNVQNYLLEASSHREAQLAQTMHDVLQLQAACKQRVGHCVLCISYNGIWCYVNRMKH
jgi:hypothetical protein